MRLINADEVQKILDHIRGKYVDTYNRRTNVNQFFWDTIRYIEKKVRSVPTVEVKEVVHGEWIDDTGYLHSVRQYKCSNCGNEPLYNLGHLSIRSNFCPYCGADMRGEKHE